jgi:predicted transcriptional regulator of viral defense system
MQSLSEHIRAYAEALPEGTPVVVKNLLHLSNRAAIGRALVRLVKEGALLRAGRGLYLCPVTTRFGRRAPMVERIMAALAAQSGEVIVPCGAAMANALGLTTQVPAREVHWTSGRSRTITLGKQVVELRHVPRAQLVLGQNMLLRVS